MKYLSTKSKGAAPLLVPFMAEVGYICPMTHNPADFVLETLMGDSEAAALMVELCSNGKLTRKLDRVLVRGRKPVLHSDDSIQRIFVEHVAKEQTQKMEFPTTFSTQFKILTKRMFVQNTRNMTSLWIQLIHHVISAVLLGSIFFRVGNDGDAPIANFKFCLCCIVFFMYTYLMVPVLIFPMEMRLLRREYFNRWYSLKAYYGALTFSTLPTMVILGFVFLTICYLMSGQLLEWRRFIMFTACGLLLALSSEGFGLIFGTSFSVTNGSIIAPALASPLIALCCYGMGFGLYIETFMRTLMSMSYLRYAVSGFCLALYDNRQLMDCDSDFCMYADPKLLLRDLGMGNQTYSMQMLYLFAFAAFHRTVAYFTLRYRLRREYSNKFMTYISKFLKHR